MLRVLRVERIPLDTSKDHHLLLRVLRVERIFTSKDHHHFLFLFLLLLLPLTPTLSPSGFITSEDLLFRNTTST